VDEVIRDNIHNRNILNDANKQIDEDYLILQNKLVFINNNFLRITELIDKLNSTLELDICLKNNEKESTKNLESEARELLKSINSSVAHFSELLQSIMETNSETSALMNGEYSQEKQQQEFESIVNFEKDIMTLVSQSKETLASVYKKNDQYTVNITDKILEVIRNVKYYDYFSTLADGIIGKLNHIGEILYVKDSGSDLEDIEYLKAKYTMHSERKIHDNSSQNNEGGIELFDDFDEAPDGEKIEFFK
jgi:hypothetical protein